MIGTPTKTYAIERSATAGSRYGGGYFTTFELPEGYTHEEMVDLANEVSQYAKGVKAQIDVLMGGQGASRHVRRTQRSLRGRKQSGGKWRRR